MTAKGAGREKLLTVGSLLAAVVLVFGALGLLGGLQSVAAHRAGSHWQPERPTGNDHITDRMRSVRKAITQQFALPYGSGCYRSDGGIAGGGEHPLGRACDFMLGPAGARATADREKLGDRIVQWARDHADAYGIWYVIFEQHIWSSRHPERGWMLMADRGGVTDNHFDHVHISVY